MAYKDDLKDKALSLNIKLEGNENIAQLEEKIIVADPTFVSKKDNKAESADKETMVPLSEVKKLIAEAMARQEDNSKPKKPKKVTEHFAHAHRLDGKWIVDFADRNYNYEENKKVDPYIKEKIHAFQKYNGEKREFEAWITLIFEDGSKQEIALTRYVERRTQVYLKIIKREEKDLSYVIGEVEMKKESGDLMVPSGIMIDQEVTMHQEIFHLQTPEGKVLVLPDYVIC